VLLTTKYGSKTFGNDDADAQAEPSRHVPADATNVGKNLR
jgi:hypothetical protein